MKTRHIFLGLMILLGCISCSDDDPQPQELTKGDIEGFVMLFDDGKQALSGEGMTVRIDGMDISEQTDALGKFTLNDVPFGVYDIIYEKSGFGTFKEFGIVHSKYSPGFTTIIEEVHRLGQLSSTRVKDLSVEVTGTEVVLTVTIDPETNTGNESYIQILIGSARSVGEDHIISSESDFSFVGFDYGIIAIQSNPQRIAIPLWYFYPWDEWNLPFSSGEEIFLRVSGDSFYDNRYRDPKELKTYHPNMNSSAVDQVSFILP